MRVQEGWKGASSVPPELSSPSAGWYPLPGAGVEPEGSLAQCRGGRVPPLCGEGEVAGMDTGCSLEDWCLQECALQLL